MRREIEQQGQAEHRTLRESNEALLHMAKALAAQRAAQQAAANRRQQVASTKPAVKTPK